MAPVVPQNGKNPGIHILLIEDEPAHAALILRGFENTAENYRITIAENLREAHCVLETESPDLIIADWLLPDGKGIDILQKKDDQVTIPLIITTSHGNEELAVELMKAGAMDYIVKSETIFSEFPHIAERTLREWRHIIDRKRAEEALHESESRYRDVVEDQSEFICRFTPDGRLTFINGAYCRYFGLEKDLCISHRHTVVFPPEDLARVKNHLASLTPKKPSAVIEHRVITPSGETRWQRWSDRAIFDPNGNIVEYQSVGSDITDRKKAEEELTFRNVVLSAQQESTLDGLLIVAETGKIISYNHRFVTLWRIPSDIIAAGSDTTVLQWVLGNVTEQAEFLNRTSYLYEYRTSKSHDEIRLKDGRILDRYSSPMIGPDATYYGRVWYFRDITERKRMEEHEQQALRQIEKNLEQLATLNDQIRNPLAIIVALVGLGKKTKESDQIMKAVTSIDEIVTKLDQKWAESAKVREFLKRHDQISGRIHDD